VVVRWQSAAFYTSNQVEWRGADSGRIFDTATFVSVSAGALDTF
jgi:hypothetical protein